MHRPDTGAYWPGAPIEETLEALNDLVRQGKVRYIGTSCYHAWRLAESQPISRYEGLAGLPSEQATVW